MPFSLESPQFPRDRFYGLITGLCERLVLQKLDCFVVGQTSYKGDYAKRLNGIAQQGIVKRTAVELLIAR